MSLSLRCILVAVSFLTLVFITLKVRNDNLAIENSLAWFFFSLALLLISFFPKIFYVLSDIAGVASPVNFVFLFFIFCLIMLGFNHSLRLAKYETRFKELAQQLAIEKFERHRADLRASGKDPLMRERDFSAHDIEEACARFKHETKRGDHQQPA